VRQDVRVRRVSVVGNSGSGKSTLARQLSAVLGVPHVELDAIHHLPSWEPIDPDEFRTTVEEIVAADGWVVDGNYRAVVVEGPVWERADTVVWVDPPRSTVMRQLVGRTINRTVRREELWNGNRERWQNFWAWDPNESVIRWAWTHHDKYRQRFGTAMTSERYEHLDFVRLRSRGEVDRWLTAVSPEDAP
jgi:adenylate kinase family enzyme